MKKVSQILLKDKNNIEKPNDKNDSKLETQEKYRMQFEIKSQVENLKKKIQIQTQAKWEK